MGDCLSSDCSDLRRRSLQVCNSPLKKSSDRRTTLNPEGALPAWSIASFNGAKGTESEIKMAVTATPSVATKVQLSPPWWIVFRQMSATIGKTPGVIVHELQQQETIMNLDLEVNDRTRAVALNRILVMRYPLGNILLQVRVICNGQVVPPDNQALPPTELIQTLKTALGGNPLFADAILAIRHPGPDPIGQVVAIFNATVVQIWIDDLSDYYGNENLVAQAAFAPEILHTYPGGSLLSFTTVKLTN